MAKPEDMLLRYKKSLEGLTPGGSEFVDDPERCALFVRDLRQSQHKRIGSLTTEVRHLREKCSRLEKLMEAISSSRKLKP